ncbi:MAG: DUF3794 domain-containing protein [Ruminococcaceae bacterium]|nr:DUF3794 domain-containing protein [Oscillospiraceae bacterium]
MENKKLTANITTNEVIFNQSAEQAIDIEFTLPDYLPSINRILKCKAVSYISSKGINGSNVNIDGCVTVTVIYLNEDDEIYSYEYQYPFNKVIDIKENNQNVKIDCTCECEYINCRAVTGRKIDIHGATLINLKCITRKTIEILSDFDDDDIEIKRIEVPSTTPMGYGEKYLIIEEEIEIGKSQQPVVSLLRYEGIPIIKEYKLVNGKIIVKGEMCITALYAAEDNTLQCVKNTIPFSQIVEIDGVNDECECDTKITVCYLEMKPKMSPGGEIRVFSLNAKLLVCAEAYCENNIEVITDAFSKKHNVCLKNSNVNIDKLILTISEDFNCKKNIELNDDISSVADIWSRVQSINSKIDDNILYITGVVCVGIIAYDAQQTPCYIEKNIDFEYKHQLDTDNENMYAVPCVEIISANYTLIPEGIELRLELCVNASLYKNSKICFVDDLEIDNSNLTVNRKSGAMIIYFATSGEKLWDIAKKYCADVEEIKQLNNIQNDDIAVDKKIMIPIC